MMFKIDEWKIIHINQEDFEMFLSASKDRSPTIIEDTKFVTVDFKYNQYTFFYFIDDAISFLENKRKLTIEAHQKSIDRLTSLKFS